MLNILGNHAIPVLKWVGVSAVTFATVVQVDPNLVDKVNQTPVTIASLVLAGVTVLMAFRAWQKSSDALIAISKQLSERPCIRHPGNN